MYMIVCVSFLWNTRCQVQSKFETIIHHVLHSMFPLFQDIVFHIVIIDCFPALSFCHIPLQSCSRHHMALVCHLIQVLIFYFDLHWPVKLIIIITRYDQAGYGERR